MTMITPSLDESERLTNSVQPPPDECSWDASELTAIMQRVATADRDAFTELYELTVPILFSFARRVLKDPADVEEIICDVYVQAWQSAQEYDANRASVISWLVMICRARAIDRYRHNRTRSLATVAHSETSVETAVTDSACDLLSALQQGSAIRGAIGRLSPMRRRLLALAFFQDLTHSEIAATSKLAVGTVKSHIRRSLAILRKELQGIEV